MRARENRGVSLIELLIITAIVGILSTIASQNYSHFVQKATEKEGLSHLASLYQAEKIFHNEWNVYFGDIIEVGYIPSGIMKFNVGFDVHGAITPEDLVSIGYYKPEAAIEDSYSSSSWYCQTYIDKCTLSEELSGDLSLDSNSTILTPITVKGNSARFQAQAAGPLLYSNRRVVHILMDQSKTVTKEVR